MKQLIRILTGIMIFAACGTTGDEKQTQSIDFGEIPPQHLRDGSLQLQAKASSGLPISYASWNPDIVVIEGDKAVFKQAGKTNIIAYQSGNEQFYEAPDITRQLLIRDWDPNKKTQEITFELPAEWKLSRDNQLLTLNAVASSGLPVSYVLTSDKYGFRLNPSTIYFYHAGEGVKLIGEEARSYIADVTIIASQTGNDEYNPADNVEKTIHVIGDVAH
jgi:hypothetical protein